MNVAQAFPRSEPEQQSVRDAIPFQWASTIAYEPEQHREILEGILTAAGMSMWMGRSNCGKTTLILDFMFRMTAGLPWLGKRIAKGACIYIAAEGAGSVVMKATAYRKHHPDRGIYAFGMIPTALNMMDGSVDVENLLDLIESLKAELLTSEPLLLIVIDTVACSMPGGDENSGMDIGRLVATGNRIRTETGAHVAWVHHTGKNEALGARGHSSLNAAVDTEIEVTEEGGVHTVHVTKQRQLGTKGLKLTARFVPVEIGTNQWGNPVTACVAEAIDEPSEHMQAVMQGVAREQAEKTLLAGFKRLVEMGVKPTDGKTSPEYLPQQMLDKGLQMGFTKADLAGAMNRLMAAGVFVRGVVGQYSNRNPKEGLVLTSKAPA